MRAFPVTKILTVVMMVLFMGSLQAEAAEDTKTDTKDNASVNEAQQETTDCKKFGNPEQCQLWQNAAKLQKETSEKKDLKQQCQTAYDKYSEAQSKLKVACNAFDKTNDKVPSCEAKIKACEKKIEAFGAPFNPIESTQNESGIDSLLKIGTSALYQQFNLNAPAGSGLVAGQGSCVKPIDRKQAAQDKKEKDRERKDLSEKIKKQYDEITKYKEELDKQKNEASEEIAKIEAENKKEALKKEKTMSDESAKISKNSVDVGKRLRNLATSITKQMQSLANTNFEYQTKMLELSDEKVTMKCKQEFEALKATIVNSKSGAMPAGASEDDKKRIAAISAQFNSKGVRASQDLKAYLINMRKDCFQSAETTKNKNKLTNSQNVKNIQDQIDETKSSIEDEKKNVTLAQESVTKLQEQLDKEKQSDESEKLTKITNLNNKLTALINTTNEKTNTANANIRDLNNEINKLTLVEKTDMEVAYGDASEAIEKGNGLRTSAVEACDCKNDKNKGSDTCLKLNRDEGFMTGKDLNGKSVDTKTKR